MDKTFSQTGTADAAPVVFMQEISKHSAFLIGYYWYVRPNIDIVRINLAPKSQLKHSSCNFGCRYVKIWGHNCYCADWIRDLKGAGK